MVAERKVETDFIKAESVERTFDLSVMCCIGVNQSLVNDIQHLPTKIQIQNWHRSVSHFVCVFLTVFSLLVVR